MLGLRHPDSPFGASHHHFLAGHCERESAITCLIREAREEAGLRIRAEDVEFAHAVHVVDPRAPGRACSWSSAPTAGRGRNRSASRTSASAGSGGPPTHCPSRSSRTPGPRSRASAPDASTPRWDGRDAPAGSANPSRACREGWAGRRAQVRRPMGWRTVFRLTTAGRPPVI
ncbi:NUDIX domain-containing protein [Streptomyces sp. MS1.HAVA.3]|uniref:NUDIX domain-containing protein n=1 Tax=Streptomyces caledonius TaxID=3134107 RepID=A0ABU8TYT7_9ACTN